MVHYYLKVLCLSPCLYELVSFDQLNPIMTFAEVLASCKLLLTAFHLIISVTCILTLIRGMLQECAGT